jgi:hypothetical protein
LIGKQFVISPTIIKVLSGKMWTEMVRTLEDAQRFVDQFKATDILFFRNSQNPLIGMNNFQEMVNILNMTSDFTSVNAGVFSYIYMTRDQNELIQFLSRQHNGRYIVDELLRNENIQNFRKAMNKSDGRKLTQLFEGIHDISDFSSLEMSIKISKLKMLYTLFDGANEGEHSINFMTNIDKLFNKRDKIMQNIRNSAEENQFTTLGNGEHVLKMIAYYELDVAEHTQLWNSPVNILGVAIRKYTGKVCHPEYAMMYGNEGTSHIQKAIDYPEILLFGSLERTIDSLFMFHFVDGSDNQQSLYSLGRVLDIFINHKDVLEEITEGGACFEYMNRSLQEKLSELTDELWATTTNQLPVVTSDMSAQEKSLAIIERLVKERCRIHVPINYEQNDLSRILTLHPKHYLEYVLNKHPTENLETQIDYACEENCDGELNRRYKHKGTFNFMEPACDRVPTWCREYGETLDATFDSNHEQICESDTDDLTKDVLCSKDNDGEWGCFDPMPRGGEVQQD